MKEKQIIEHKTVFGTSDTQARRRSNISNTAANITAAKIEAGVSIEELDSIGVPVLRYQTQVTIHGKLPDISGNGYINGYKSIVHNKNGSIGVRYTAIDGGKKGIILKVQRFTKCKLYARQNSQGMELIKSLPRDKTPEELKTLALSILSDIPTDLFIGSKYIMRDIYGGYYVVATFEAIPESNLWAFVSWFTSGAISDNEGLQGYIKAYDLKREQEKQAQDVALAIADEKKKNALQPIIDNLLALGCVEYDGGKYNGLHIIRPVIAYSDGSIQYNHFFYETYGKRFRSCCVKSIDVLGVFPVDKWKNPSKYYTETIKGYKVI